MTPAAHRMFLCLLSATCVLLALPGCTARSDDSAVASTHVIVARGVVDVDGGLVPVLARRDGHVAAMRATLGGNVEPGSVLAQLNDETERSQVDVARADLQHARAELAAASSKLPLLQDQFGRLREAEAAGAESGRSVDDVRLQLDMQRAEVPIAEATVTGAQARLDLALRALADTEIRAPAGGRVVQVSTRVGALVSANDATPLFLIRPATQLIVRATLAASDADRIAPGTRVAIEPADHEGKVYTARVREVGELARKPDPTLAEDDFASERAVDCVIELGDVPLRIGSVVLARFSPPPASD